MNEFELIDFIRGQQTVKRDDVLVGIGDDAAVLMPPQGQALIVSADTLLAGVHFYHHDPAAGIAYKAMAVNLSDMAAMGGKPAWATLVLTMPEIEDKFVASFAQGLFGIAEQFQVEIVGGDTCRGPLSITIQMHGFVEPEKALRRNTAQVGDDIYVSGTLGDAALALAIAEGQPSELSGQAQSWLKDRLLKPTPRVSLGMALGGVAHAAIDISDGVVGDLKHMLNQSGVGANVWLEAVPLSPMLEQLPQQHAIELAMTGGEDYELCFTAAPSQRGRVQAIAHSLNLPLTRIGEIVDRSGLYCSLKGQAVELSGGGYQHFE